MKKVTGLCSFYKHFIEKPLGDITVKKTKTKTKQKQKHPHTHTQTKQKPNNAQLGREICTELKID